MSRFKVKVLFFAFCCCCYSALAGYPTIQEAGFHHCALIYQHPDRNVEKMAPFVAKYINGRYQDQWMFDTFCFLHYTINGKHTETAKLTKADFEYALDVWFTPGRDVDALNQAVHDAATVLGEPPAPRQVIFAIYWLNPEVTDFGDVDGDGISEDLSQSEDRIKVIQWYVNEILERMKQYPRLKLWGFYFMREHLLEENGKVAREVADVVHSVGKKLLWIPWFRAHNYDKWKDYGIDVAIMQSNYAFTNWSYQRNSGRTGTRSNRLDLNAELCRKANLGVEIELGGGRPMDLQVLYQTMDAGRKAKHGYQFAPTAYYLGSEFSWNTRSEPEYRMLYHAFCDYIAGRDVIVPACDVWNVSQPLRNGAVTAIGAMREPRHIAFLDIFFYEPFIENSWTGTVYVDLPGPGRNEWVNFARQRKKSRSERMGSFPNLTFFLDRPISHVRVRVVPDNRTAPQIFKLGFDELGPGVETAAWEKQLTPGPENNVFFNCRYDVSPVTPGQYDDPDRRKLFDGKKDSVYNDYIGWTYAGPVSIAVDLGKVVEFDELRLYSMALKKDSVVWPAEVDALISCDYPIFRDNGYWQNESEMTVLNLDRVKMLRGNRGIEGAGYFQNKIKKVYRTRYLLVTVSSPMDRWKMISELELYKNGKKIATSDAAYDFYPAPTPRPSESNEQAEEGEKKPNPLFFSSGMFACTDGVLQTGEAFLGEEVEFLLHSSKGQSLSTVTVVCAGKGEEILFPKSVTIAAEMPDGTWSQEVVAEKITYAESNASICFQAELPAENTGKCLIRVISADPKKLFRVREIIGR